jgi:hypothetical protein
MGKFTGGPKEEVILVCGYNDVVTNNPERIKKYEIYCIPLIDHFVVLQGL